MTERECFDRYVVPAPTNEMAALYRRACFNLLTPRPAPRITRRERLLRDHPNLTGLPDDQLVAWLKPFYPDLPPERMIEVLAETVPNKKAVASYALGQASARCFLTRAPKAANTMAAKLIYQQCAKNSQ